MVLKTVIDKAVGKDQTYDSKSMTPESTALALVVENLLKEGVKRENIDLKEIEKSDSFDNLVEQIAGVLEDHGNVTDDDDVEGLIDEVTDKVTTTTTALTAVGIDGERIVGETLTAYVTPTGATVTYQWMRSDAAAGTYTNITGATGKTYKLSTADKGKYIKVKATGTGNYTGTVTSAALGPIQPYLPVTLRSATPDDTIEGTPGYTRFAQKIEVDKSVKKDDYEGYYIFEVVGKIEGVFQVWSEAEGDEKWDDSFFIDQQDGKYSTEYFDLIDIDLEEAQFQTKIDGNQITYKAYIVAKDKKTLLSNVLEKTITANPEKGVYNKTKDEYFEKIQAAIDDSDTGEDDEIFVYSGTYDEADEAISIGKSLAIIGVNSTITGGINITSGNVTIKGFTIEGKGILASNISGLTLENNEIINIQEAMAGSPAGSVIGLDVTSATGPIVIKNNEFTGIGVADSTGTAIRMVKLSGETTITNNKIEDVTKNGINIYSYQTDGVDLTITGNEINNWDSDMDSAGVGGRAIRIEFNNKTGSATITGNTLTPPVYDDGFVPVDPEYVKITGSGNLGTKDFNWGDIAAEKIVVD